MADNKIFMKIVHSKAMSRQNWAIYQREKSYLDEEISRKKSNGQIFFVCKWNSILHHLRGTLSERYYKSNGRDYYFV